MKRSNTPLIALLSLAVITGCATAAHPPLALSAAPAPPPSIGPQASGAESEVQIDTSPVAQQAGLGVDQLFDFVQRDFQAVTDMAGAANPVDQLGKDCGSAVTSAIAASRKNLGTDTHVVGLASAAERLRLAERSLVFYMPVYLEARDRCRAAGIDLKAALAGVLKFAPGLKGVL